MAPTKKAKAAGVSASSFLDLKAELAKQETEFSKKKASGGQTYVAGGAQRPDKKPTVWARPNKGVRERNLRDIEAEVASRQSAESARAVLERKAKIYEKLKKGKSGGLTDAQYDNLLVDFDSKPADDHYSSDSEDVDESLTVPRRQDDDDDPIIEYEDEFGRVRTAPRSEVPRHLMPSNEPEETVDDDPYVIHNPSNFFPVFEQSAERVEAIRAAAAEEASPLEAHYDAARENRSKGAAFYTFSKDEETRARQMEELRRAREETEKARQEAGAIDVKPGEVEGLVDDGGMGEDEGNGAKGKDKVLAARSRAMEKRKRELEERKKLIESKRRKVRVVDEIPEGSKSGADTAPPISSKVDTFAALEVASASKTSAGEKGKAKSRWDQRDSKKTVSAADDFLSQLEKDLQKRR